MKFLVTVEKLLRQSGTIEIEADNDAEAVAMVDAMMVNQENPLQTIDKRIQWDEPEYEDFTFQTTGDVT